MQTDDTRTHDDEAFSLGIPMSEVRPGEPGTPQRRRFELTHLHDNLERLNRAKTGGFLRPDAHARISKTIRFIEKRIRDLEEPVKGQGE